MLTVYNFMCRFIYKVRKAKMMNIAYVILSQTTPFHADKNE